jgi:hypothetical protein
MPRKPIPPPVIPRCKPRSRTNGEHVLTVAQFCDSNARSRKKERMPMIRMRGQWLEQMGFRAGEYVIVTAEPKRLVLTIAEES